MGLWQLSSLGFSSYFLNCLQWNALVLEPKKINRFLQETLSTFHTHQNLRLPCSLCFLLLHNLQLKVTVKNLNFFQERKEERKEGRASKQALLIVSVPFIQKEGPWWWSQLSWRSCFIKSDEQRSQWTRVGERHWTSRPPAALSGGTHWMTVGWSPNMVGRVEQIV